MMTMGDQILCACGHRASDHDERKCWGRQAGLCLCVLGEQDVYRAVIAERDAQLALLGDKLDAETEENNELSRAFTLASENMNNAECQLADARQELAEAQREIARCVERSANAVHDAIDEHESSICPEDFGCRELIASLERQLAEARRERDARPTSGMFDLLAERVADYAAQLREADVVIETCVAVIWQNADDDAAALLADAWREKMKEASWRKG